MRKKILLVSVICCLLMVVFPGTLMAQTPFSRTNVPAQIKVTTSALNVRSGPGVSFLKVGVVYQGQIIDCLGKIGSWWVVHLENDVVGVVSGSYAKPYYPPSPQPAPQPTPAPAPAPQPASGPDIGIEEQKMVDLINAERAKVGLAPLAVDVKLMDVAKLKAEDMVKNNYFSHTSPTYGSPFDMLKQFGVSYKYAGENIAGNSTVEAAHQALMNSQGHRENILSPNYTHVGIGITDSPTYGKIFVQLFIGR